MSTTSVPRRLDVGTASTKPSIAVVGVGGLGSAALQNDSFEVLGVFNARSPGIPRPDHVREFDNLDRLIDARPDVWVVEVHADDQAAVVEAIIAPILGAPTARPTVIVIDCQRSAGALAITRQLEIQQKAPVSFMHAHLLRWRMPAKMRRWLKQIGPLESIEVSCTRPLTHDAIGRSPIDLLYHALDLMYWACPATLRCATGPTRMTPSGSLTKAQLGIQTDEHTVITVNVAARYGARQRHFEIAFVRNEERVKVAYRRDDLTGRDHLTISLLRGDQEPKHVRAIRWEDACALALDDARGTLAGLRDGREPDECLSRLQRELMVNLTLHGLETAASQWPLPTKAQ